MSSKRIKDWATSISSFRSGDVIAVDGPSGTAKMSKDDLLKETAQNSLAGNVAPAFDPTRTSENPYKAGEKVAYGGKTYIFKVDHYGAWSSSDVAEFTLTDSIDNIESDISGATKTVSVLFSTSSGGYYHASVGTTITLVSGNGNYTPFGSSESLAGIDVSEYVGGILSITMTTGTVGVRNTALTDKDGLVLAIVNGSDYSDNGDGTQSASIAIPAKSKFLFWSAHSAVSLVSLKIKVVGFGVVPRIEKLERRSPFFKPLAMTTSYANVSIGGEGVACPFTKSLSTKVSGQNGGMVIISVPDGQYDVGSIGIYFPWESQKVVQLYVYYDEDSQTALLRANYKSAATGWVFYQQGEGFIRVNFPKGVTELRLRIDTRDHDGEDWEFYVSDNFVFNDDYPIAPVCIMYDGGAWAGRVIDDGVEMSLWQLHHKYNIPYGIGTQPDNISDLNPEVAQDVASGFAHIILRSQPLIPYYNEQTDTQITEVLRESFTDINADSRMLVLAEHKLDKKIYRVAKQGNVDVVRTGPANNFKNTFGQKFGDCDLFCVHSGRLGGTGDAYMLNYPIILWEHGVGIPPEGWTGLTYVDPTGENTPVLFKWLHQLMTEGKALCLSPSDFIAYCKSH